MANETEFEFIAQHLAPLSQAHAGAFRLKDDAAVLTPSEGCECVMTSDVLVEGRHFLKTDPLDRVARKALRVNLSDLAAMGAEPRFYMMSIVWPVSSSQQERSRFVRGLALDQERFGVTLIGGDTTSAEAPLTICVTAIGEAPQGACLKRSGAKPGDFLVVTGTIGDGVLGLLAARTSGDSTLSIARYQLPEPRLDFGMKARDHANAAIDVSDGLIADASHLAEASRCGLQINLDQLPLSSEAIVWLNQQDDELSGLVTLATGGDDYELVLAVPPQSMDRMTRIARDLALPLSVIGTFNEGEGIEVLSKGQPIQLEQTGFTHF